MSVAHEYPDPHNPYGDTYGIYTDDLHWPGALPIGLQPNRPPQPCRKASPPAGYTGDDGTWPTSDQLDTWARQHAHLNIGLRLPSDIVGIDIDHYISAKTGEIKQGADLLTRLEAEHGPLPATWRSTSRGPDNPSGVRLYRVPAGTRLQTAIPGGIELIQRHHRYIVCWPSIHPDPDETGRPRTYHWYTPVGDPADQPPAYDADDIPDLPWPWITALTAAPAAEAAHNPPAAPQTAAYGEWSDKVTAAYDTGLKRLRAAQAGGRHDTATAAAMGLCRLEQLGSRGATTAIEELGCDFVDRVAADRADHGRDNGREIASREWDDIVTSGRHKAMSTASTAQTGPDPLIELLGATTAPAAPLEDPHEGPDAATPPQAMFLNWDDFWAEEPTDEEWLIDQVFARGRGHALYAQAKQGKSLFVLHAAARLAVTNPDADVIYLDYEMTRSDVRDRLEDMGYGPTDNLTRLHYALLPAIPPLDTAEGAYALIELCDTVQRPDSDLFVVVDTTGRAVEGEENSNDTIRGFYRWTGTALKRRQITWVRLDHAGKDITKGQRGGSAKNDDVDIVWKLQAGDDGAITLHCDAARMSWVRPQITFTRHNGPLRYTPGADMWPAGTKDIADHLDALGLPNETSRRCAKPALTEAGIACSNDVLAAAIRYRKSARRNDMSWIENSLPGGTDHSADH